MSYKIKNTALDHTKRMRLRTAPKMEMEPIIGGQRLRLNSTMTISDELFDYSKTNLELYKSWGVIDWEKIGGESEKKDPETDKKDPEGEPKKVEDAPPEPPPPPAEGETSPEPSKETKPQQAPTPPKGPPVTQPPKGHKGKGG